MDREALEAAYDLFSKGDREGFVAMFTPDAQINPSGVMPGLDDTYRGHDGIRRWFDELRDSWASFRLTHDIAAVEGDRCLVDIVVHGRGAASGAEVRQQVWHVIQMEGSRATHHWSFWDHDAALAKLQERKTERPG